MTPRKKTYIHCTSSRLVRSRPAQYGFGTSNSYRKEKIKMGSTKGGEPKKKKAKKKAAPKKKAAKKK